MAFALAVGLLASGCKPADPSQAGADAKPRVALVMKSLANEFFLTMENGAKAHKATHSMAAALKFIRTLLVT